MTFERKEPEVEYGTYMPLFARASDPIDQRLNNIATQQLSQVGLCIKAMEEGIDPSKAGFPDIVICRAVDEILGIERWRRDERMEES